MTAKPRFALFAYWRTSATYRVRVALALNGITAAERIINIDDGEHRQDAFLAINPLGAIPALIDRETDALPLTQSLAILEYLNEIHPAPPLLPPDPIGRARVRSLSLMLAADTHSLIVPRVKKYLTTTGGFDDQQWRDWQTHWFTTGLQSFEKQLGTNPGTGTYCHCDVIGMADICLASIIVVMRVFGIGVDGIPTIERIMRACEANTAFSNAEPRRQVGAPPD